MEHMFDLRLLGPESLRPLKRSEYDRLVDLGAFEGERVELLYGLLVRMSPIGPPHMVAVAALHEILVLALHGRAKIHSQSSYSAGESRPEPDLAVLALADYRRAIPEQALLLVEVADSSLKTDREVKGPLYARSNVLEYWIVDVEGAAIEVYREPDESGYRTVRRYGAGEAVSLLAFPEVSVRVSDVIS